MITRKSGSTRFERFPITASCHSDLFGWSLFELASSCSAKIVQLTVQPRISFPLAKERDPSLCCRSAEPIVKRCQHQPLTPRKIQVNRVVSR